MSKSVGQAFTTVYNGLSNVLKNNVGIGVPDDKPLKKLDWLAIWDTGATGTVITQKVVQKLNLKPIAVRSVATPQGTYDAYCYYVDLYLPNHVSFPKLLVMEGQPAGCDVLIGMDVIGRGDFAVSNYNGRTSFSYRYPTMTQLNFVENSYLTPTILRATANGPAKNSNCPCGSGKKYKQCCGKELFK